jgi:hypothetical protein
MTPGLSPLVGGYSQWIGGHNTMPALPRPLSDFLTGAFGPLSPIIPMPIDEPGEESGRAVPRRWEYPVGWNLPMGQPGTEGLKLASFTTLRRYADMYCLSPETRVLCADLRWRPIGTLTVGDNILAFDEQPGESGRRKFRMAEVQATQRLMRPSYRVRFTDGREVVASAEHRWLRGAGVRESATYACVSCGRPFARRQELGNHGKDAHGQTGVFDPDWITTAELSAGCGIRDFGEPWHEDQSRAAGYLAGAYDGEASLSSRAPGANFGVYFAQKPGVVLDHVREMVEAKGYSTSTVAGLSCSALGITSAYNTLRFLGEMRPLRLLPKVPAWLEGRSPFRRRGAKYAVVESVEFLGDHEVVAIGTSTHTLIAEGLFSHNSVVRACINIRRDEMAGMEWDVGLTPDAQSRLKGDRKGIEDAKERAVKIVAWFKRIDSNYNGFQSWFTAALEEQIVIDAVSLYLAPTRVDGKGLFKSDLAELQLLSGSTIRPLLDLKGSTPRPPCYSADTEILSRRGWVRFAALASDDEVATRSTEGRFEWQLPTRLIDAPYEGSMVHFTGRSLDCLVTPDHLMLTTVGPDGWDRKMRERDSLGHFAEWKDGREPGLQREWLIPASALLARDGTLATPGRLVAKSTWDAPDLTSVEFSEEGWAFTYQNERVEHGRGAGRHKGPRARNLVMSGDDYAAFMGMWLSEGCVLGSEYDYRVVVSQTPAGKGYKQYREVLSSILGRDVGAKAQGWNIYRKSLALYLRQFGKSHDKFLPRAILDLSQRQLRIFWEFYWLGDGTTTWKQRTVATASRLMADGLQEVLQKIGYSASATFGKDGIYHLGARQTDYPEYNVSEEQYSGHVYCVTVPNGVVYVRRNGHPIWSGNSPAYQQYLWGVPRSELQTVMTDGDLDAMSDSLRDAGMDDDIRPDEEYRADQLLYIPRLRRSWTPYGFGPIEQAIIPITLGMSRQNYLLDFYSEGSIPGVFVVAGDQYVTPAQQRQLQDTLNAIAGDVAWKHRVIVLPPGSKADPQKNMDGQWQADTMVAEQVAMILHIQPHEIGMMPGGRTGGLGGGKGQAEQQASSANEQRTLPDAKWWKETAFDWIIQRVFKQTDLEWKWLDFEESEDDSKKADTESKYISMGKSSIDELRVESGEDPWNFPLTSSPFLIVPGIGMLPLDPSIPAPTPAAPAASGTPGGPPAGPAGQALAGALQPDFSKNPKKAKNNPAAALLSGKKKDRKKARNVIADRFADNLHGLTKKPPKDPGKATPFVTPVQQQTAPAPQASGAGGGQTEPVKGGGAQGKKMTVADLVKGRIKYKDSKLPEIVETYLLRSYPAKDVAWAADKAIEWEYDPKVKLTDINMARRPGGRNPEKVEAVSDSLGQGASMDPVVLVEFDTPDPNGLTISDGWHRTLGAEKAGWEDVPAFVGHNVPDQYTDTITGAMQQDSDSKKAAVAELATLRRFVRKGGQIESFRTAVLDKNIMSQVAQDLTTVSQPEAFERARATLVRKSSNSWGVDGEVVLRKVGERTVLTHDELYWLHKAARDEGAFR